jgi:hypothetical protein
MGDKTVESLKKVLTPEQVERLPAGQENDFGGGRRNRGNDGAAPGARPPRDNGGGGDGNRPPR